MPTADLGTDPRVSDVFRTVSGVNLDIGPFDRLRGTVDKATNQHSVPRWGGVSASCPRIVLKDSLGYELDTYTTLQEAIYRAKWNVRTTGHAQTPLEWRLPKAPPPARPDLTRTFPPVKHPQLQGGHNRRMNNLPANILEIDVDDVSFVKESLDRLPFVPSLSFLRQEFLVGPKTYFQIVGTMLLHKKLLSETEKRHAIYNFPGFCSGCIRMGLCYGCERSSEPHYHEDKLVKTGGGFTYYKKDRPERELRYRNPINWKISHPEQVLKKLMEDYTGVTLGGDISEKVQEHLDEYGDTYTRKTKETSDIDRDRSNVDGNMSTRQATRGDDGRFLPEIDPRYINEQQDESSLLDHRHLKDNRSWSQSGDRGIDPDEVDIEMYEDSKRISKPSSKKSTKSMLNTEDENSTRFESALDVPDVEYLQSDTDTGKTDDIERRYDAKSQRTFNDNRRYEHRLPKYRKTDTDDDTEDEERRKNYEADDEGRSRKKDRLYKPPPAFKLKKSPKRRIDSKSPFSTDRSYDIPKGREFVPRKSSKKPTEFVDFRNVDVSWKEPKKFELKKSPHKPTKFWSGVKSKKKEKSRSRSPKIRRAPSPRSVSPDSGLDTGFITASSGSNAVVKSNKRRNITKLEKSKKKKALNVITSQNEVENTTPDFSFQKPLDSLIDTAANFYKGFIENEESHNWQTKWKHCRLLDKNDSIDCTDEREGIPMYSNI